MLVALVEADWICRHTRSLCRDNSSMSGIDNGQRSSLLLL